MHQVIAVIVAAVLLAESASLADETTTGRAGSPAGPGPDLSGGTAASATSSRPVQVKSTWAPKDLLERLGEAPKTPADEAIRAAIAGYEARLEKLKGDDPLVKRYLPRLRDNILLLYREYNQNKARYTKDCFSVEECLETLKGEMAFFLDNGLDKGRDPLAAPVPTWLARVCWVESANIIGQYHLSVPKEYDPAKAWPCAISYQNGPEKEQRKLFPYFFITGIQKDYPVGMTTVENKTRCFFKDAAREFNVDPLRLYATGFSFGGHTDLTIAWRFPHWFAAITPLCSDLRGADAPKVKFLKNVPALLLHGEGDSFLANGKTVYEYMKQAGCDVTFQTYPGGHDAAAIFRGDVKKLVDFWDKHALNPYPKTVCHVVEHPRYSRAFWADAKLTKPAATEATFEVRVQDGNKIELDANDQVAELDLYLCDKLVDMAKPVTVTSAGKVVYEGKADKKVAVKLRDGEDYPRGRGDTLWEDILEIRQAAARPTN